ncbi:MAG: class II aldolase/adducin family protein [Rhodospirillales bacterium]|nr:class II aldolase/adducin family protein [Rhodospirillales bacterium]
MNSRTKPPAGMGAGEWQARVDLAACYRLVDMHGWSDLLGTHISARVPGEPDHFLLNPYGNLWDEMCASDLIKVDMDGNVKSETNGYVNPAGFTIHSAILMARPEVNCAMHTHTPAGVGVATQKGGLLPITQHALHVLAHLGYAEYGGFETDPAERDRIAAAIEDHNVLVLKNHGLITAGRSVGEAFVWMYRAERACKMQLAIQQAGAEIEPIDTALVEKSLALNKELNSDKGHRPIGKNEWPALLRKLDRVNPGYDQ